MGRARRMVAGAVLAYGHEELVEAATLLVSEVVANSVLRTGTELRARCRPRREGIRVEVSDGSPVLPTVRDYGLRGATGRRLTLVSAVATSWGVEVSDGGKTFWFERRVPGAVAAQHVAPEPVRRGDSVLTVHLREASVPLIRATIEHSDALLRELALLAVSGDDATPTRWRSPQFDVSPILTALDGVAATGRTKADLELILAPGSHSAAVERRRRVEHADGLAGHGAFLCAPALPEVAACRRWLYDQAAGWPPQPWQLPESLPPARDSVALPETELEDLQRVSVATVVAETPTASVGSVTVVSGVAAAPFTSTTTQTITDSAGDQYILNEVISDGTFVTRNAIRVLTGPVAGAIIGQVVCPLAAYPLAVDSVSPAAVPLPLRNVGDGGSGSATSRLLLAGVAAVLASQLGVGLWLRRGTARSASR